MKYVLTKIITEGSDRKKIKRKIVISQTISLNMFHLDGSFEYLQHSVLIEKNESYLLL